MCPGAAFAASCDVDVPKAEQIVPNDGTHDATALSEAVRAATNTVRCARGLAPLATDPALVDMAERYSRDMAQRGFFAHQSPVEGRETLRKRADDAGIGNVNLAENLITGFFVDYDDGDRFSVVDRDACEFRDADSGRLYDRLTYRTMADDLVARWMDSTGHRRNILSADLTRHGFGMAVDPKDSALCGKTLGTQVFAGG